MTTKRTAKRRTYKSPVLASIHETVAGMHEAGVFDKQTMDKFDKMCLTPVRPLEPKEIKEIREREQVSQSVFANYLGVTVSLVSKWERGEKHPSGAALKLLALVDKKGLQSVA